MSALESMIRTVLNAMDLDVEEVKAQVTSRIKAFEQNLATLNATLISHDTRLARIEKNLVTLMAKYDLPYDLSTKGAPPNGHDTGGTVPSIEGPKAGT